MTTKGRRGHWSRKVYKAAQAEGLWRASKVTGPVPWENSDVPERQEPFLFDEEDFARLHLTEEAEVGTDAGTWAERHVRRVRRGRVAHEDALVSDEARCTIPPATLVGSIVASATLWGLIALGVRALVG